MTSQAARVLTLGSASRWFEMSSGRVTAVDDVSLRIDVGEIVGLAGPSGSGKTTLLNLVAGWEMPDSGTVDRDSGALRGWSSLAVVPQELGLIPELTAVQNIELAGRLSSGDSQAVEVLFDVLDLVGLGDRMPDELSVGEQQRVAVAVGGAVLTPVARCRRADCSSGRATRRSGDGGPGPGRGSRWSGARCHPR